jgi:hypothetical protein
MQALLYPIDLGILRSIGDMEAHNVSLSNSHPHNEMLHLGSDFIDRTTDVAKMLEHQIGRIFSHNTQPLLMWQLMACAQRSQEHKENAKG